MTYPPQSGQWDPRARPPGPKQPPPGQDPAQDWSPQPPPQKQGAGLKLLLIGVAVLLVIAISVGITLVVTRDGSPPGANTSTAVPSVGDVASANDTGAVSIITSEPTCPALTEIHNTLVDVRANGWSKRDQSSESQSWTPQVRAQYEAVGAALRTATDQAVGLAKQTPHRVVREMYEQFITYGRAYADSLSSYEPKDDLLALVNINVDDAIAGVCGAINFGGIATRASLVSAERPPSTPPLVGDVSRQDRFVKGPSSACVAWEKANPAFLAGISDWEGVDSAIPATAWTPEQRRSQDGGTRAMGSYATTMESLGQQQGGVFEDFATLGALYLRAYVAASPSYVPSDGWVFPTGLRLNNTITEACKAAGG